MAQRPALATVVDEVQGKTLVLLDDPIFLGDTTRNFDWTDLPIKDTATSVATTTHITQGFDILEGHGPVPNIEAASRAIHDGAPLEHPFSSPVALPSAHIQYVLVVQETKWVLIKHFTFKQRAPIRRVAESCVGNLWMLDMRKVPANRYVGLIVQHILVNLGGAGIFNREVVEVEKKTNKRNLTANQINAAYDFIEAAMGQEARHRIKTFGGRISRGMTPLLQSLVGLLELSRKRSTMYLRVVPWPSSLTTIHCHSKTWPTGLYSMS